MPGVSDRLLRLYHRLPPPMRSVAATLRGAYLRRWRYGPETERLVEKALEREQWSLERWKAWREERLAFVLHRAATRVPYYRQAWAERRRHGDGSSWERLENWPVLEKGEVRRQPEAFVADDCDIRRMYDERTSGTTGTPLRLWWGPGTVRLWFALLEARWWRWHGVSRDDRWAILGGQLIVPVEQRRPPFWVWNAAMKQLYMSSFHLAPDLIPYYLEALERHRVRYVLGYGSNLNALAQEALRVGWHGTTLRVAVTNAEPLFDHQRRAIEQAFGCPARETYGMVELVAAASECPEGTLHLWPEVGWIEAGDGQAEVTPAEDAAFVCTGLLNADMPLIRYRVGDWGRFGPENGMCRCGRLLPTLASVGGRLDDILFTADGRSVGRLSSALRLPVRVLEAQMIQESLHRIRVLCVPAPGYDRHSVDLIVDRLRARMGKIEVVVEQVDHIPRGPYGKFRAVVNLLDRTAISNNSTA